MKKDEILTYWSLFGSLLYVIPWTQWWFKMQFSHKTLVLSPAYTVFVCLFISLSLNRLPLRSQPLLSPSHICHLRLNRWEKDKSRKMRVGGKRLHSSSVRLASRLQIYIFPVGEYENGKMPSKFPACQSVNRLIRELQYHGEVSVSLGRCAYTHQQCWLLPAVSFCHQTFYLNLRGNDTFPSNIRWGLQCRTKLLILWGVIMDTFQYSVRL